MGNDQPQLRMKRDMRLPLPEMTLAKEFVLREAGPEDSDAIAKLLSLAFGDDWTVERVNSVLLLHPEVPKTFVITSGERPIATASYQVMPQHTPGDGWVHYVGADPEMKGFALGYNITLAVLQEAKDRGCPWVYLTTDDHRLPAIRTYEKLGFQPDCHHESHEMRWRAVRQEMLP
jgi:mycothiol synthase